MLVVERREDESVVIGGSIIVTVGEVKEGRVKLAIQAPRGVRILRDELLSAAELERVRRMGGEGHGGAR